MDGRRGQGGPIAVIGMACRFPGARDPAEFHDLIVAGLRRFRPVSGSVSGRAPHAALLDPARPDHARLRRLVGASIRDGSHRSRRPGRAHPGFAGRPAHRRLRGTPRPGARGSRHGRPQRDQASRRGGRGRGGARHGQRPALPRHGQVHLPVADRTPGSRRWPPNAAGYPPWRFPRPCTAPLTRTPRPRPRRSPPCSPPEPSPTWHHSLPGAGDRTANRVTERETTVRLEK